jgi:lipoprotein-anchoring transpeptidase ErfK/SrfK
MATLYTLLDRHPKSAAVVQAENWIGQMNWQELMADRPGHGKVVHNVRRGDSLASIAKKYDTTIELVQAMNDIEGTMIRMGQGLYVCTNRFEVVSSPSSGRVRVMAGDRLFKSYPAGFARIDYSNRKRAENASGGQEPLRINGRYENPDLKEGGRTIPAGAPQNYLGAARLTIDQRRLSIHGSRPDDPIENFTGPGCIRMRNSDVMELFLILPLGTPVYFEP